MKKKKFSKARIGDDMYVERKKFLRKNNIGLIIVAGMALLMIFSIFTIGLGSNSEDIPDNLAYNEVNFVNKGGAWYTKINGIDYGFEYAPGDAELIESIDFDINNFNSKTYLLFNPAEFSENSIEINRLRQFLLSFGVAAPPACIEEEGCGDIPIVDCNNINKPIYLKNGDKTHIYQDQSCIVLEAVPGEEALVMNKFMYKLLGVL